MRVLVTGGMGFIGRYVIEELQACGHEPIIFDHHRRLWPDIEVFLGDVMDPVAVTEAMAHADAFIHLAAVLGTQETIQNPRPAAMSNIVGGLNILEASAQYGVPGTYIGVGNHWMNNTYSITKTTVERFIDMFNNDRGTCINIVRAMNAYGPRQVAAQPYGSARVRKITPSFCCRAIAGDDIEIYGDGLQVSDMVWVGDVAKALVKATELAADGVRLERPVEIGPATNNTVLDVAKMIHRIAKSNSKIVHLPMRPGEIPGSTVTADVTTLEQVGMSADELVGLEWGMTQTVDYFRETLRDANRLVHEHQQPRPPSRG